MLCVLNEELEPKPLHAQTSGAQRPHSGTGETSPPVGPASRPDLQALEDIQVQVVTKDTYLQTV